MAETPAPIARADETPEGEQGRLLAALEARVRILETKSGEKDRLVEPAACHEESEDMQGVEQAASPRSTYFCARLSLLLITVMIAVASLLTFGPTIQKSTLNHIFIEALYPISLVSWTVHEHVYSGVVTSPNAADADSRTRVCTLDGVHFLVSASTFFLCFAHCFVISNWPYVLFQGVNGVVSLLPFFFLPALRAALRSNAIAKHGSGVADVAVTALKRGISVLSLMTFLLSEATSCIGLSSPASHVGEHCQYAVVDNFILNHIAFLNLFDTVVVETGIAPSRTALIQCRSTIPMSVRACAAGAAILTIFCIGLFSTRYSLVLFGPATGVGNTTSFEYGMEVRAAGLVSPLPMLGWMVITAVVFCNMSKYLKLRDRRVQQELSVSTRRKRSTSGIEMVTAAYIAGSVGGEPMALA